MSKTYNKHKAIIESDKIVHMAFMGSAFLNRCSGIKLQCTVSCTQCHSELTLNVTKACILCQHLHWIFLKIKYIHILNKTLHFLTVCKYSIRYTYTMIMNYLN